MSTVPVIELHDLSAGYGSGPVLRGLDLTVEAGEFIAVLGPNGSGKTTLLKVLEALDLELTVRARQAA